MFSLTLGGAEALRASVYVVWKRTGKELTMNEVHNFLSKITLFCSGSAVRLLARTPSSFVDLLALLDVDRKLVGA